MAILGKLYRWSLLPKLFPVFATLFKTLFLEMDTVRDGRKFGFTKGRLLREGGPTFNRKTDQQQETSLKVKKAYLFPLAILLYITGDTAIVFAQNDWHYSPYGMETLLFHRLISKPAWLQFDRIFLIAMIIFFLGFTFLLFDRKLDHKFVLYYFPGTASHPPMLIQHGKVLEAELSTKLIDYWKRTCPRVASLLAYMYVNLAAFYLFYFFRSLTGSWYDLVRFFLLILLAFDAIVFAFAVLVFFIQTTGYLIIKQKHLLTQISRLSGAIELKMRSKETKNTAVQKALLGRQLNKIKAEMGAFYEEIAVQNRFWSKYLTLVFILSVFLSVTLTYATLFDAEIGKDPFIRAVFIGYGIESIISCLAATWQSSKIVRTNVSTARELQRCSLKIQAIYGFNLLEQLKMDQMASSFKSVSKVSFRLLDNYRINSQMFEGIFFYTSIIFMTVFKDHHHIQ